MMITTSCVKMTKKSKLYALNNPFLAEFKLGFLLLLLLWRAYFAL